MSNTEKSCPYCGTRLYESDECSTCDHGKEYIHIPKPKIYHGDQYVPPYPTPKKFRLPLYVYCLLISCFPVGIVVVVLEVWRYIRELREGVQYP